MTTTDTLPAHIAGLCRAIDDGDDTALPILADALEEMGDARAAGLRKCVPLKPTSGGGLWYGSKMLPP